MEQHEAVYEQIIEINNTTGQGNEYLSQHLVEGIVVQNENNQESTINCEISNMDIVLSNDCVNIQDQCNINVTLPDGIEHQKQEEHIVLQNETTKEEYVEHVNNSEEILTNYTEFHKEIKTEEYVIQNETTYHEQSYKVNNSIVENLETDRKEHIIETIAVTSEIVPEEIVETSELVPETNVNEPIPEEATSDDVSSSIIETNNQGNGIEIKETKEELLNVPIESANVETMEVDFVPEINEVEIEQEIVPPGEPQSESYMEEQLNDEKVEVQHSNDENVEETNVTEEQTLINSDDVAVLTEFSGVDYDREEILGNTKDQTAEPKTEVPTNDKVENNMETMEVIESAVEINEETVENNEIIEENEEKTEENKEHIKIEHASKHEELEEENAEEEDEDLELHLSTQSNENHRKVIQDIFDDWTDENGEEDPGHNQSSDVYNKEDNHDSVEMELQNLLNDDAHQVQTVSSTNTAEHISNSYESKDKSSRKSPEKTGSKKSSKSGLNQISTKDHSHTRSTRNSTQEKTESLKQKVQSPRPGVKVPGLHLTSPIATTAEVNEVLNKRLKEKQKDLVQPATPDIVLIKKITQRLSNQLSQVVTSSNLPSMVQLQSSKDANDKEKNIEDIPVVEQVNKSTVESDNNELLAILEGDDVDPDWSNLKPVDSSKTSSPGSKDKLDPVTERELALKQLLELPSTPTKKISSQDKKQKKISNKTEKIEKQPAAKNSGKSQTRSKAAADGVVINVDSNDEDSPKKSPKAQKENNSQNTQSESESVLEVGVEESRSGRKRKLTEKAREHELSVKRQKVVKGRATTETKKSDETGKKKNETETTVVKELEETPEEKSTEADSPSPTPKATQAKTETKPIKLETKDKKAVTKTNITKGKLITAKQKKIALLKKDARISKRKLAVKNLMRQKVANKKAAAAAAKAKEQATATLKTSTPNKTTPDKTITAPTTKKKAVSEIDRLLQDEGVVNMLYNAEQPDSRKRLVPITKSQKKIMDIEKAERELKLRTKLVKNAVLRLRNSAAANVTVSPRARRSATSEQQSPQSEKKPTETTKSSKPTTSTSSTPVVPSNFVMPAKIRNAADASRIIRRHSSSSFSSASASPRVSIDMPNEAMNFEELETPIKTKRKLSNDSSDKFDTKKTKKKIAVKSEVEVKEEKPSAKKDPIKKLTRSNVTASVTTATASAAAKAATKNKKVPKSKTTSESSSNDQKPSSKNQDELSACLAEVVSALSSINGSSRASNAANNRRKGSTNSTKTQVTDDDNVGTKKFSNKEINVRQHGHLVQLIMTPSVPVSGIRNAITIPVMDEIREALSILKKDDTCRVVLLTTTGTSFCEGLDISHLLHSNKDERKTRADEMATAVKEFIKSLASFNKPIVAGVQGAAIGLGVTMLPLFDLVIASDKATFCTPYGKLGQIAEGAAILTLSHSLGSAFTNELLLGGRVLTASEALRAGLVTRVLWPDRFQGELLPSLKGMSEQSAQSMEATKALLRLDFRKKLDAALNSEISLLIEHWCSTECQEAIKTYIDEKGQ